MYYTNPKTKGDLLNRILSQDFTGDFRDLAVNGALEIERVADHQIKLKFQDGPVFILAVKKPKPLGARIAAKERWLRAHDPKTGHQAAPTGRYAVPPDSPVGRYETVKPRPKGSRKPASKGPHAHH